MAWTNSQYEEILRDYDLRRQEAQSLLEERRREVYAAVPGIEETENEIAAAGIAAASKRVLEGTHDSEALHTLIREKREKRQALLTGNGYPADYLDLHFDCPLCEDTGFINGRKCSSFLRAEQALLGRNFEKYLPKDAPDLSAFSLSVCSPDTVDPATGRTHREAAAGALRAAKNTAEGIGRGCHLFLHGQTGVGKTFLSQCIAREALEKKCSVMFFSAPHLMELLSDAVFRGGSESGFSLPLLLSCDLLVIDDLGTELTNAFVNSQLFRILSERIDQNKTTVISTNLSLAAFRDTYSERIFSRVMRYFTIVKLCGEDLRLRTKLEGGTRGKSESDI